MNELLEFNVFRYCYKPGKKINFHHTNAEWMNMHNNYNIIKKNHLFKSLKTTT